jgi:hypothetical protein
MTLSPEELYLQLGQLAAEMPPDLAGPGPITPETQRWIGRAVALVEALDPRAVEVSFLKVAAMGMEGLLRAGNAQTIATVVHAALAKAELQAPARVRGKFIAAGSTLDAFAAVGSVLRMAKSAVLLVDPYADSKALTDFGVQSPDGVAVRLLADQAHVRPTLKPAMEHWLKQFGRDRPLEVRLTAPKTLHDRLILIDGKAAWILGQSFNALAARSPTSIVEADAETASLKVGAYDAIWLAAKPLL